MKVEKENTSDKVETLDAKVRAVEDTIELRNEEIMKLEKLLAQVTEDLETATFNLGTANRDLDEYDKINREAELEISSLQRQVANKEESVDNTEARILMAQEKFAEASEAREDSERQRKVLESRCNLDGERIKKLEQQLQEAQLIAEDSDKKYDIVSMKLAKFEAETERADDRLSDDQARITELTEEYKIVSDNMKSLEASEAVALAKEESYEEIIRDLTQRLKDAENRASEGQKQVSKLSHDQEATERELMAWQDKHKVICQELETTYNEMAGY